MSHRGRQSPGTGLRDVFDILVKAPSERLLSLTIQLGESPEDNIIHALCLIILQREPQALNKLQMLGDNSLARHLAGKWQMSEGKFEDIGDHCGHFQALTGESLAALARIFKVLCEQRLCHPLLRNVAYKRALSCQKTSSCDDMEYDQFREEAKVVCGPQFAEWTSSSTELKSESCPDSHTGLSEENTTLKVTVSQAQSAPTHCLPSPLQETPSEPSYPTHIEMSIPPTISFQGDRIAPEISGNPKLSPPTLVFSESDVKNTHGQSQTSEPQSKSSGSTKRSDSKMHETLVAMSNRLDSQIIHSDTPNKTIRSSPDPKLALPPPAHILLPNIPVTKEIHESKGADEEEEEKFYAFVILHAPEDEDMAESMKEKLETIVGSEGATFSGDFAIPGKSTLRCVEDAINNSAFAFLLLTRNFNTRMLDMKTNTALMNSINKEHKFNTVIPLLPKENCMPRQSVPLVLQTIVPLEENKSFEKKIQKSLSPARIEKQRRKWTEEQRAKIQRQERQKLSQLSTKESTRFLMEQKHLLVDPGQDGGDGIAWWPQHPNICIQNAKYIMIGNDSQMTVGLGGNADNDDSLCKEEEQ